MHKKNRSKSIKKLHHDTKKSRVVFLNYTKKLFKINYSQSRAMAMKPKNYPEKL